MVFEQKFDFSVVVFCSHAAISLWFLLFFRFFGSDFFLNGFPNPFTAHSKPSFFVWIKFSFLASGFFVHMRHFDSDFWFFFLFFDLIFLKWFSQLTHSPFFVAIFVTTICRRDFCYDHMTSQSLKICFLFIRSCNFNWIACVTSFFALSGASFLFIRVIKFLVTLDLPHSQKWLPHFEIDFNLL